MRFLGVDGGGTKTEFLIIDENGNILSHSIGPTCHYKQTSISNFEKVLREGICEVCNKLRINPSDINYSFIGIPGFGEIESDRKILESIVGEILGTKRFGCGNDAEVAWAGSLACQPGINIVAGTGAIGFGIDENGKQHRASGWGHICGDEGSAHWIGKKIIEIFTKQADGRLEKTNIYKIVKEELNIEEDFDILDIVLNKFEAKRDKIAGLGKILYLAAEENDELALEIYRKAAYEHYLTIKTIVENLSFKKNILVSYSGGVFNAENYILDPLKELLLKYREDIVLTKPILDPVKGAALYALNLSGLDTTKAVENLKE